MIIARIESLILKNGLEDAIKRAEAYIGAGADAIMIHSKEKAEYDLKIRGRDLLTGLPKEVPISCEQITKFLERSVRSIVDGVKTTLEITPPELIADIYQRGLVLVGGGSLLRGLDTIIAQNIKIPVRIIDDPITCAVRGMGIILEDEKLLHEVIVPTMRDEERS